MNNVLPRYNGPAFFGVRPQHPIFLPIPVAGECVTIQPENLPIGVTFNAENRVVGGVLTQTGDCKIDFTAENKFGKISFAVIIKVGEDIALTPPMGWNSWYCFSETVSDERIRQVAKAMVDRGLAAHGWNFINIDDCYQGERGGKFNALQGNERFPDFYDLISYVHNLGLRFGLYSTPWISTYAGFRGGSDDGGYEKLMFLPETERLQVNQVFGRWPGGHYRGQYRMGSCCRLPEDVRQWADWQVNYVKMDWNPNDVPTTRKIAELLRGSGRDIILSLSNSAPVELGSELAKLAQLWRITGDIHDNFDSIKNIGFAHDPRWRNLSSPGHWNDPDMLQIGAIGVPNQQNTTYKPSDLSYEEQKLQFSLWSLMSAPLLLSCDIAGMDDETFGLLTNDEVIAIDQDVFGAPAIFHEITPEHRMVTKVLADGSMAIGLFNLGDEATTLNLNLSASELAGKCYLTDLWSGEQERAVEHRSFVVSSHGVVLLKLS